jgi:hypothetical protein
LILFCTSFLLLPSSSPLSVFFPLLWPSTDAAFSATTKLPPFMTLDVHAIRNLELFENTYDRGSNGTLFEFLDNTKTPMGKRLFREWLVR